jgi:hypothetical protein
LVRKLRLANILYPALFIIGLTDRHQDKCNNHSYHLDFAYQSITNIYLSILFLL